MGTKEQIEIPYCWWEEAKPWKCGSCGNARTIYCPKEARKRITTNKQK